MKILYLCADPGVPVFGRKGCSTHVRENCLTLMALGNDVRLVCSNSEGDDEDRGKLDLVTVRRYYSRKLGFDFRHILLDLRLRREAEKIIADWKPDAIYERYSLYSRAGTDLALRHRLPHLLEVNAFMTREQKDRIKIMPLARRVERRIIRRARHVVVVSQPLLDDVVALRGGTQTVTRMPMAVNVHRFNPTVDGASVRKNLGLEGKFVLGYVGTLTGWHGIDLLHQLAVMLKESGMNDFVILVVGGDDRRLLHHREKAKAEGLEDVLRFLGPVGYHDVPAHIRAMDVGMIPDTTPWSSPAKLFEYQGCGIPVLAPRHPAIEAAMVHGREGFMFEPRDVVQIAHWARHLHENPTLRIQMGRLGRNQAATHYSWEAEGRAILDILERQAVALSDSSS